MAQILEKRLWNWSHQAGAEGQTSTVERLGGDPKETELRVRRFPLVDALFHIHPNVQGAWEYVVSVCHNI